MPPPDKCVLSALVSLGGSVEADMAHIDEFKRIYVVPLSSPTHSSILSLAPRPSHLPPLTSHGFRHYPDARSCIMTRLEAALPVWPSTHCVCVRKLCALAKFGGKEETQRMEH